MLVDRDGVSILVLPFGRGVSAGWVVVNGVVNYGVTFEWAER